MTPCEQELLEQYLTDCNDVRYIISKQVCDCPEPCGCYAEGYA